MPKDYIEEDWERQILLDTIYLQEDEQEFNENIPEYGIIEIENEIYELTFN